MLRAQDWQRVVENFRFHLNNWAGQQMKATSKHRAISTIIKSHDCQFYVWKSYARKLNWERAREGDKKNARATTINNTWTSITWSINQKRIWFENWFFFFAKWHISGGEREFRVNQHDLDHERNVCAFVHHSNWKWLKKINLIYERASSSATHKPTFAKVVFVVGWLVFVCPAKLNEIRPEHVKIQTIANKVHCKQLCTQCKLSAKIEWPKHIIASVSATATAIHSRREWKKHLLMPRQQMPHDEIWIDIEIN